MRGASFPPCLFRRAYLEKKENVERKEITYVSALLRAHGNRETEGSLDQTASSRCTGRQNSPSFFVLRVFPRFFRKHKKQNVPIPQPPDYTRSTVRTDVERKLARNAVTSCAGHLDT